VTIDRRHPSYEARRTEWRRIRDVLAGEDAVKRAGARYLPMLSGMEAADYAAYLERAMFFEATARTVDGLLGAVFRKEPIVTVPPAARALLANATQSGVPFDAFAKDVAHEVLALGRCAVLVDAPPDHGGAPYLRRYRAEDILNWRVRLTGGVPVLSLVVLREVHEAPGADPFETVCTEQRRILALEEEGYVQQVWRLRQSGRIEAWRLEEEHAPMRGGNRLRFIPVVFIGPTSLDAEIEKSPVLGLANVNLSHYRSAADLEHGAHFTALPTPWVTHMPDDAPSLRIGSGTAWLLPEGARVGMLEYSGQGLAALELRLERKERTMAVLGGRLLEDQKRAVEAAETLRLRHRGENSILAGISGTIGRGLERALAWLVWWAGHDATDTRVTLNRDFVDRPLSGSELTALISAWQAGAYPDTTLWRMLREGEVIPPDIADEELAAARNRRA
jgi:Domain of unknown function (DUF4055)